MSQLDHLSDEDIQFGLRREFQTAAENAIAPFKAEIAQIKSQMQSFGQRLSRPPGSGPLGMEMNQLSLSRQLTAEAAFQSWVKSQKLPSSGYATELRLPAGRKSVLNLSPTEHLPLIQGTPAFPLRLRSIMPNIPVTSGSIEYTKEASFVPSAAVVPEGGLKPALTNTYTLSTAKCATVAQFVKASVQALADTPMLQVWLDNRLMYACSLKEEDTILNGDVANSISGLMTLATPFVYTPLATDNYMDVVAHAAGALQGAGYSVDGVVMNSSDYTHARLLKSTTGQYLFLGTASAGPDDESIWESTPLMWTVPLVISPSMPAGSFLIGGFMQSTMLLTRDVVNVQVAFQNEDDFIRNLVTMRAELRTGIAVPVPSGLLKGSFTGITGLTANAKK